VRRRTLRRGVYAAALVLLSATLARAECRSSGRQRFVAGLEALNRGDLSAAARVWYQLVEEQPTCAEARNNLAVVFVEQGRFEEAAEQLREALRINPGYHRARVNLERIDMLQQARREPSPRATGAVEEPAPPEQPAARSPAVPWAEPTPSEASRPEPTPTEARSAATRDAEGQPVDGKLATEPLVGPPAPTPSEVPGTVACVIEPAQHRLCVYRRSGGAIANEECYAVTATHVRSWPRWVVASEVSRKRIRLLDETGQTRLEILAEDAEASGDALYLRQGDLDALATKVVPWRTGWLILE
jgi:tetratricopeptide (TPR) repeat protein